MEREKILPLFAATALLLSASLSGQTPPPIFRALGRTHLPPVENPTAWVTTGDVDGDGDVDLVTGNRNGVDDILYLNDGEGHYAPAPKGSLPSFSGGPLRLIDLDSDGDLDLVLRGSIVYLNDGKGNFKKDTQKRIPINSYSLTPFAFGDVDGDGDPDLVFQLGRRHGVFLVNDGKGFFSKPYNGDFYYFGYISEMALGDADGDGDLDLGVTLREGGLRLFLYQGKTCFQDATSARISALKDCTGDLAMVDLDGDGDLDILSGGLSGLSLYANDGKGFFTNVTSSSFSRSTWGIYDFVLADLDGDKDLDLMAGGYGLFFFRNHGKGFFKDETKAAFPFPWPVWVEDLAAGDFDGDGTRDVFLATPLRNRLLLNDGQGRFIDACRARWPAWKHAFFKDRKASLGFAFGDVDADGDRDVVSFGVTGAYLYLNDGRGWFTQAPDPVFQRPMSPGIYSMAMGDADGDGDLDLFFGGFGRHWLFLNDGRGNFKDATSTGLPSTAGVVHTMLLGDVDGDRDLDLLEGTDTWKHLFLNDGKGRFKDASSFLPKIQGLTRKLVFLDADRDGDLDLFAVNDPPPCTLYLNGGIGRFTDFTSTLLPKSMLRIRCHDALSADVDRDGDMDIFLSAEKYDPAFLINDSKGVFSLRGIPGVTGIRDAFLAVGDLDGDSRLDLLCADFWRVSPFLNIGNGQYLPVSFEGYGGRNHAIAALGLSDLDGDGDPDLLLGTGGSADLVESRAFFNISRQVQFPWIPSPGRRFAMAFYARPKTVKGSAPMLPFLSPGEKRTPIPPLGVFGLNPARFFVLPPLLVSGAEGKKEITLRVPRDSALLGRSFYVQGLAGPGVGAPYSTWRFTAVEAGRVR